MSNKKLFWIAFFILSCCEFGQVAYSKNMSTRVIDTNPSGLTKQNHNQNLSDGCQATGAKLSSNALPR